MTLNGQHMDTELVKVWSVMVQRFAVIVLIAVLLYRDPANNTAWLSLGAVLADLFHQQKANGNGSPAAKQP